MRKSWSLPSALLVLGCLFYAGISLGERIFIVAHEGVPQVSSRLIQRLYTGKSNNAKGVSVTVVNMVSGHDIREDFLTHYLKQDNDKYEAYWMVRRYIGQGTPPKEIASVDEMLSFIKNTPGAIGYVGEASLKPDMNIILKPE